MKAPRPAALLARATRCYPPPVEPTVSAQSSAPKLSVVVPVRNEADNIDPLVAEIRAALSAHSSFEIIYVDDGSNDATPKALAAAGVRSLRHKVSCGQSSAVITGIRHARAEWVATLDGDGQNDPADIPALFDRALLEARSNLTGPVLIAGHRTTRRDSAVKRVSSRMANSIRAGLLGDATPDTGCGLKVFRRDAFLELPHFDHMHRFLPALFIRAGGRVISVPVNHRPRTRGHSNYGTFDRLWVGISDLLGVFWLIRRWKRPSIEAGGQPAP